jgi:hypothetical protein
MGPRSSLSPLSSGGQGRPKDEPAQIPKWMGAPDAFTPLEAAGLGLALVFLN